MSKPSPTPKIPRVEVPVVRVPQPDGSILFKAGKPRVVENEISTTEFARKTGISQRHVQTLCEQGGIDARKLTSKPGSRWRILATEVDRFLRAAKSK